MQTGLHSFAQTAKQWRDANPGAEGNLRDHAPLEQLVVLTNPLSSSTSSFQRFSFSAFQFLPSPVPIRDRMPGLAKELADVIDKALARNPKNRFPDAAQLLASLPKPRP